MDGRVEEWKGGRMEGWKSGRLEEWMDELGVREWLTIWTGRT
jgi:hypothetical protein